MARPRGLPFYVSNVCPEYFRRSQRGDTGFQQLQDNNDNKPLARVGFLPIPGVEVGYGFEIPSPASRTTFSRVQALFNPSSWKLLAIPPC